MTALGLPIGLFSEDGCSRVPCFFFIIIRIHCNVPVYYTMLRFARDLNRKIRSKNSNNVDQLKTEE
jgi:hypothetical protein